MGKKNCHPKSTRRALGLVFNSTVVSIFAILPNEGGLTIVYFLYSIYIAIKTLT